MPMEATRKGKEPWDGIGGLPTKLNKMVREQTAPYFETYPLSTMVSVVELYFPLDIYSLDHSV
jgi:hypothetical protein